jgi:hypothetical protein
MAVKVTFACQVPDALMMLAFREGGMPPVVMLVDGIFEFGIFGWRVRWGAPTSPDPES